MINVTKGNRKAKSLLIVACLAFFITVNGLQKSITTVAMDKAVKHSNVDDAWDFPDNDGKYNHTLGTGVKVAVVDTGIDWQHPDFYRPDFSAAYNIGWNGTAYYIDFTRNGTYEPIEGGILNISSVFKNKTAYTGSGIDPGVDYGYADTNLNGKYDYGEKICYYLDKNKNGYIDTNDKAIPLDKSKIKLIRDYSTEKLFLEGFNLTNQLINDEADHDGHGTHIAGIIAGGWPGVRAITGVAPNCTLLIYKVASWNNDNVSQGIYDAVNDGADIISLSYAEHFKNITLDGSGIAGGGSKVEDAIDWAWSQGVPVIVAAGNFGNKWVHNLINVPITDASVPFDIPSTATWNGIDYDGCYEIEFLNLWGAPNEKIGLNVTLPDPSIPAGQWTIPDDFYGGPTWNGISQPSGSFMVQRERYKANNNGLTKSYMKIWRTDLGPIWFLPNPPAPGIYDVFNYGSATQQVHTYINSRYGDSPTKWFSGFPGANWMPVVNPFYTIASPATADHCIVVGSYITTSDPSLTIHSNRDISEFSSCGPRVDGVSQIDVIAPGEIILSTASRNATGPFDFGPGNFTSKRGTSMAAPHLAGIIALAMDSNNYLKGKPDLIEELVIYSTYDDIFTQAYGIGYDNITGSGKVDALQLLIDAQNVPYFSIETPLGFFSILLYLTIATLMIVGVCYYMNKKLMKQSLKQEEAE